MGLIYLRHAYSRYLAVKEKIEPTLPARGGKPRPLTKEDFCRQSAIFLKPEGQFDCLVELPKSANRAQAMKSIELDYETRRGVLPKSEYQELDDDVLVDILRTFNDPALNTATATFSGAYMSIF